MALDPADNSLVAQSLLADLAVQTSAVFDVLPSHIAETRLFASKVAVLKPAAGRFLVTAGETADLKAELARCALSLDSALREISDGAKAEHKDVQEARIRLLKVIKAKMGNRGTDAEQMSLLLTAKREGNAARPEKLKVRGSLYTGSEPLLTLRAARLVWLAVERRTPLYASRTSVRPDCPLALVRH